MPCCAIKARLRPHWASEPFLGLALGILETKLQLPSCLTAHNCETTTPSTPCCRTPAWFRPHQVLRPGFGPSHSALQHPWELNYDSQHPLLPLPGHKLQLPGTPCRHKSKTTTPSSLCGWLATPPPLPACLAATSPMPNYNSQHALLPPSHTTTAPSMPRGHSRHGWGGMSGSLRFWGGVWHHPGPDLGWGSLTALWPILGGTFWPFLGWSSTALGGIWGSPSAILGVGPLAILGRGPPPFWGGLGHPSLPWSRF